MKTQDAVQEAEKSDKNEITVTVYAPKTPDPKQFTWLKTMRVGEAAQIAATAFGYVGGTPALQNQEQKVLDNQKTLVAAGVRDGDKLELIDHGGGV